MMPFLYGCDVSLFVGDVFRRKRKKVFPSSSSYLGYHRGEEKTKGQVEKKSFFRSRGAPSGRHSTHTLTFWRTGIKKELTGCLETLFVLPFPVFHQKPDVNCSSNVFFSVVLTAGRTQSHSQMLLFIEARSTETTGSCRLVGSKLKHCLFFPPCVCNPSAILRFSSGRWVVRMVEPPRERQAHLDESTTTFVCL